ncbi:galactose mutarotase-like domain-containing protein [Dunaliella salina]|uniref:Galactose mutarotase-like domain-containing protein n=1 Tax=Dunaliella salina TaxID=3046 RepID=A0ABQ7H5K5_DUNSA|nr:galactose mutarotase-like domain-containing protein [Dunaliella salina]|eukprot:KAF5842128.1 galactose mutarotase-like domain-containing protein [Dunaliella salina]
MFKAESTSGPGYKAIMLRYTSPAGEEGYPGELDVCVTYRLACDKNELTYEITATPIGDATPVNIVQHTYWNMAGHDSGKDILDHQVHMPSSDHYTPVGGDLIPTGEILPVQGTPFDFTRPHTIGERIQQCGPAGYDLNYVNQKMGPQARFICKGGMASDRPKLVATVHHKDSGRCMELYTTAPGMQFYVGGQMEHVDGKGGAAYKKHAGFCLETQAFPNSVNERSFPDIFIKPGETYHHQTVYKFYTQ